MDFLTDVASGAVQAAGHGVVKLVDTVDNVTDGIADAILEGDRRNRRRQERLFTMLEQRKKITFINQYISQNGHYKDIYESTIEMPQRTRILIKADCCLKFHNVQ